MEKTEAFDAALPAAQLMRDLFLALVDDSHEDEAEVNVSLRDPDTGNVVHCTFAVRLSEWHLVRPN